MKFDLINPSDPYTLDADDLEIAAVAVCLIGDGQYPATALGDDAGKDNDVPAFLFGGPDEWLEARFGANFVATAERCLNTRTDAVARALESRERVPATVALQRIYAAADEPTELENVLTAALQQIADMDPAGQRADDLGRAALVARTALAAGVQEVPRG